MTAISTEKEENCIVKNPPGLDESLHGRVVPLNCVLSKQLSRCTFLRFVVSASQAIRRSQQFEAALVYPIDFTAWVDMKSESLDDRSSNIGVAKHPGIAVAVDAPAA